MILKNSQKQVYLKNKVCVLFNINASHKGTRGHLKYFDTPFMTIVNLNNFTQLRNIYITLILLYLGPLSYGLNDGSGKTLHAKEINETVKIDGLLNEDFWQKVPPAKGFKQTEPIPGKDASYETEVRMVYDNNAVYIGVRLFDPEPHKILKELSLRDRIANADNFFVFFDTYQSGQNGFLFSVTASGVQKESVVTNHQEDITWDAVWESQVHIDDLGWTIEIKIPYLSLRFPDKEIQDWNIQFSREIRRYREKVYWSEVNPAIDGWVQQSGKVLNIKNIKPPVRLSLVPYVSGYINTSENPNSQKTIIEPAYAAGLDLKYGINNAFTLDMTLIPDFGQVISDRQVLNLTPFEVFFEENRQFFTEGTEMFNRGDLFYSRRVGGAPVNFGQVNSQLREGERLLSNPSVSQLYNAFKISGRDSRGTGLGVFNALVGEEFATVVDESGQERRIKTNPLTNYSAVVIDQNLKNNSFVSLINTHVLRSGEDYDANVTGAFFNVRSKDQNYYVGGSGVLSQRLFTTHNDAGYNYKINAGKISGTWIYELGHSILSERYNPNDFGFLFNANQTNFSASGGYNVFKPKTEKLQLYRYRGFVDYNRLYSPHVFTNFNIGFNNFYLYKSRFGFGFNTNIQPIENYDYFEPRTRDFSQFVTIPRNINMGGFISSDYRKPFALDLRINQRWFDAPSRFNTTATLGPRFRFNDKFTLFSSLQLSFIHQEPGFTNKNWITDPPFNISSQDVLIGVRDRVIVDNSLTVSYIFNHLMGVNMRIRHYWDKVEHKAYGVLDAQGFPNILAYDGTNDKGESIFDRNVNIFNIDLQYNWRFAPGSDIIFVWKNEVFNNDKNFQRDYLTNLSGLFSSPQTHSISLRVLYFLDYLYLFPNKNKPT